jgi:hypothetical protein
MPSEERLDVKGLFNFSLSSLPYSLFPDPPTGNATISAGERTEDKNGGKMSLVLPIG